jgi:hypothetical protein
MRYSVMYHTLKWSMRFSDYIFVFQIIDLFRRKAPFIKKSAGGPPPVQRAYPS